MTLGEMSNHQGTGCTDELTVKALRLPWTQVKGSMRGSDAPNLLFAEGLGCNRSNGKSQLLRGIQQTPTVLGAQVQVSELSSGHSSVPPGQPRNHSERGYALAFHSKEVHARLGRQRSRHEGLAAARGTVQ